MTLLDIALAAADAAGEAIRPWFRSTDPGTERKGDASPVTRADREAEQAMRAAIARHRPDDAVLGEEFGIGGGGGSAGDPGRGRCWVLDPIDGTRAFITGRPSFTTLVALLQDGVPVLGIIDQPVTGERWVGQRGERTRFTGPLGGSVGTRACRALAEAELSATSPAMFEGGTRARFDRLAAAAGRVSWGGDTYAYGLLALGQIDVVAEATMRIWDWAAVVPVVEGAGGSVTDWNGQRLRFSAAAAAGAAGEVLAVGDIALRADVLCKIV